MPVVPASSLKVLGHVVERATKGVVHAIVVNESATAWGKTACGLWFTRDKKTGMMARNGILGSFTKRSLTCIVCIGAEP